MVIASKQIYCLACREFMTVAVDINECPRCHARFRCVPVDYLIIKKKIRTSKKRRWSGVCGQTISVKRE